jgi:hypothetical protein
MVRHEAEREMQQEIGIVLDRDLENRIDEIIRTENSELRGEISGVCLEVLDREIPSDYRSTIRVVCQHGVKGLVGLTTA